MARTSRRWAAAVTLILLLAAGCGESDSDDSAAKRAEPTPIPVEEEASDELDIEQAGAKRIDITGDWLAAGEGGIWLSADTAIHRLDPDSGRRVATIPVPQGPCEATDVGFGAIWTATCTRRGLAKIDPAGNRVIAHVRLPLPEELDGEGSVGAGEGAIWLVTDGPGCGLCRVARVDPRTLERTGSVKVMPGAATVRTGEGAVWVANPGEDVVQRIDPAAMKVTRTVKTGITPRFFDVGEGAVWTLNQGDGTVSRIDPAGEEASTVQADVFGEGGDLTVGGGSVWARGTDKLLTRIDPGKRDVAERYGPSSGSGAVIVGAGAVWVSAHDIGVVWRLPLDAR